MSNFVQVIDKISGTILFKTSIEKIADAYTFAEQMEEAGLDIEIIAPGLLETMIHALGANDNEIADYKKSMDDEIADHIDADFGCAICPPGPLK